MLNEKAAGIEDDAYPPAVVQIADVLEAAAVGKKGSNDAPLERAALFTFGKAGRCGGVNAQCVDQLAPEV